MTRDLLLSLGLCTAIFLSAGCINRYQGEPKEYTKPLPVGATALIEVPIASLPKFSLTPVDRKALQQGIQHSLKYLATTKAAKDFKPDMGVTREQIVHSLEELDKLLKTANDDELDRTIRLRFRALMSVGCDNAGTMLFTGYYTPILAASYTKEGPYQFPIYKLPSQLVAGPGYDKAQWRRRDGTLMECPDVAGLEAAGLLQGYELAYLTDPFEAYVVRIQGSAKLRLPDGQVIDVGFAGTNGHPYVSISKALIADGKLPKDKLNFFTLRQYFQANPQELAYYVKTNPRQVFFTITSRGPYGSLGQLVTSDITIAANKEIFPPGGPVVVQTKVLENGVLQDYCSIRLDQDNGGAMRAPGRADLYMGIGESAEQRAGVQEHEGKMWYLVLK